MLSYATFQCQIFDGKLIIVSIHQTTLIYVYCSLSRLVTCTPSDSNKMDDSFMKNCLMLSDCWSTSVINSCFLSDVMWHWVVNSVSHCYLNHVISEAKCDVELDNVYFNFIFFTSWLWWCRPYGRDKIHQLKPKKYSGFCKKNMMNLLILNVEIREETSWELYDYLL